jgi:hypothetical protein
MRFLRSPTRSTSRLNPILASAEHLPMLHPLCPFYPCTQFLQRLHMLPRWAFYKDLHVRSANCTPSETLGTSFYRTEQTKNRKVFQVVHLCQALTAQCPLWISKTTLKTMLTLNPSNLYKPYHCDVSSGAWTVRLELDFRDHVFFIKHMLFYIQYNNIQTYHIYIYNIDKSTVSDCSGRAERGRACAWSEYSCAGAIYIYKLLQPTYY